MRRIRPAAVPALVTVLLAAAAGCGGGGKDDGAKKVRASESGTPAPPSPSPSGSPSASAGPSPSGSTSPAPSTSSTPTTSGTPSPDDDPDPTRSTAPPPPPPTTKGPTNGGGTAGPPSAARLTKALLTTKSLPSGYFRTVLPSYPPNRSSRPDCVQRLNSLELNRTTYPGAVETRAAWAKSRTGPYLQQVLRWYPKGVARAQVDNAARALAGCGTYTVAWPDGDTARQTVTPLGSAGIGERSWHARITVEYGASTVEETMVLVVVRGSLIVLSHLGSPAAPDRSQSLSLARAAADRVP